ncbi:hypothetical protein D3C74_424570 [compost metagenome]
MLHVANINIISTRISKIRCAPVTANNRSVRPCNTNPRKMVNFDPLASASCPPNLEPIKLQIPAKNKIRLISVMVSDEVVCKNGVIYVNRVA